VVNIYPPFLAKILDDNGRLSKEWHPFFNELYAMLKGVKTGSSGNLVSIDSLHRLGDSDVVASPDAFLSLYDQGGENEFTSGAWADFTWDTTFKKNNNYSHSTDDEEIRLLFSGDIKITYHLTAYTSSYTDLTTANAKLQLYRTGWEDIDGTLSIAQLGSGDNQNLTGKRILTVKKKDKLKLVGSVTAGSSTILTVANACSITIERLT